MCMRRGRETGPRSRSSCSCPEGTHAGQSCTSVCIPSTADLANTCRLVIEVQFVYVAAMEDNGEYVHSV